MNAVFTASAALIASGAAFAEAAPLRLHPDNPHYFLFRIPIRRMWSP